MADTLYYSINEYPGNGTQRTFEFSFAGGYISREHVKVALVLDNGAPVPFDFAWVGDSTIMTALAAPAGYTVRIYRETPKVIPLADFTDGAIVTEANLDINSRQAVFIAAEAADAALMAGNTAITTKQGAHLLDEGFILVTPSGTAVTTPYIPTLIRSGVEITDFGTWGGSTTDYGAWG